MGPEAERILSDGIAGLRPPSGAKQRGWQTLQRRIDGPAQARPTWVVPLAAAIALAAALVLLWALASSRTVVAHRSHLDQAIDRALPTDRTHTTSVPAPILPSTSVRSPTTIPVPPVIPPPPRAAALHPTTPVRPLVQDDALARATAVVAAGQRALANDRADVALAHARAHRREFPSGALAEDAGVLEIAALCRLGRTAEATTAATALRTALPGSSLARALAEAPCGE